MIGADSGGDSRPGAGARRLAQIEVQDADARRAQLVDVHGWPVSIGRALDNDLVLADPHVAAHHARLELRDDGSLHLHVLDSLNGAQLEGAQGTRQLARGEQAALAPLARWHLGRCGLRVHRPEDALAEELPLPAPAGPVSAWITPALAALALLWQLATLWLGHTEEAKFVDYLAPLVAIATALVVWVVGWGLLSKLFGGRFVVLVHLWLALAVMLAGAAADFVLPAFAFALDWPLLSRLRPLVTVALGAALVALHLSVVAPRQAKRLRVAVAGVTLLGLAIQMATQWQRSDRLFPEIYADVLMPPAVRLARPQPVAAMVERLREVEQPLGERWLKALEEEFEP
jgi:hypothetical protein